MKAKRIEIQHYGVAASFDLKGITVGGSGVIDQQGYIMVQVSKGNTNDRQANAYGHYSHTTFGVTGSISIRQGGLSIGGVRTSRKMPDTMILFRY